MQHHRPLLAALALAAAPGIALAQVDPGDLPGADVLREEATTVDRGPFRISLVGGGLAVFDSNFEDADSSIASYFARTAADLSWKASDTLRLNLGLAYEAAFYEIEDGENVFPDLGEDDPFDTLHSIAIASSGQWYFKDPWYAVGAAIATAGWEPGADFGEAWTFAGFGGVGYRFSDRLTLALGAGGSTRLEDDAIFYPYISVRWQATERLLLESEGLGLRLTSAINEQFDAYLRGGYEGRSYRLDEDRSAEPSAVLEDRAVFVGVGIGYRPIPNLRIALEGGAAVYRELELRDAGGDELSEEEVELAPYLGLTLRYTF